MKNYSDFHAVTVDRAWLKSAVTGPEPEAPEDQLLE